MQLALLALLGLQAINEGEKTEMVVLTPLTWRVGALLVGADSSPHILGTAALAEPLGNWPGQESKPTKDVQEHRIYFEWPNMRE